MDESASISATLITNNGKDVKSIGYVKKSLEKYNWWETDNTINSEQWNPIWVCTCIYRSKNKLI